MRSLVLKALSRRLQVEFTYIKSGKQVRFMADSDIKTSFSLPLCFPLPSSSASPPHHTDSSACSWLLMCGSRAGWKTYCPINHVPFFSATRSTRRLVSDRGPHPNSLLCATTKVTNILRDKRGATSNRTHFDILISFK